jgi:hypothetical protein
MTIVTDFDIGEEVMLENGEIGAITSIRIVIREGKSNPDYKVEYEINHNFVRYAHQLRLI